MYVLSGGDIEIAHDGKVDRKTLPTGAPVPAFPAGAHQVTNVGSTTFEVIFVEPTGKFGPTPDNHVTPFETNPDMYTKLGEDADWVIGQLEMKAGATDAPHSHHDHFIYVTEGDEITIYPGTTKDEATKMVVPISTGAVLPAPGGHHVVMNSGSSTAKMIFFEMKHNWVLLAIWWNDAPS